MQKSIKKGIVPLTFNYDGRLYKGMGIPVLESCRQGVCFELNVSLNGVKLGTIYSQDGKWEMPGVNDAGLVNAIGQQIQLWYE
jgi:hypothetical protein